MKIEAKEARRFSFVFAWIALLLLASASLGSAFLHLGAIAPAVEFGIAAAQAAILFILFHASQGAAVAQMAICGVRCYLAPALIRTQCR